MGITPRDAPAQAAKFLAPGRVGMLEPTDLEIAVIKALSDQLDLEDRQSLLTQFSAATVIRRENSGVGFFTYFSVDRKSETKIKADTRSLYVSAAVDGLDGDLGFILWTREGALDFLEGHTEGSGTTVGMDLIRLNFRIVDNPTKLRS
jgi:hypothetical protein